MYGHLFKDGTGHYLFIKQLGYGVSCQCQLVRHCETGKGAEGGPEGQFNNDVETAKLLARQAQAAGIQLQMPIIFSDATIPDPRSGKSSRISYWSLCNGGNLGMLTRACSQRGVLVPRGLVLRILQQVLETLHFMYKGLPQPLLHCDLHAGNILLHFPPGNPVPDFHLMDFGAATWARDLPTLQDLENLRWDIAGLMGLIETELVELTMTDSKIRRIDYLLDRGTTDPICIAYQMLEALDNQFKTNLAQAIKTFDAPTIPDITPVLHFVREHAMRALPELMLALQHNSSSSIFGNCAINEAQQTPQLYLGVEEVLQAKNVPGPWYVALIQPGSWEAQVVAAGGKETHHRPNESNKNSVTDQAWCSESGEGGEGGDWENYGKDLGYY